MQQLNNARSSAQQGSLDSGNDSPTKSGLAQQILNRDPLAESALAQRYTQIARRTIAKLGVHPDAKEDLFQDAFVSLLRRLRDGALKDERKLDGYIRSVVRFTFLADLRKRRPVYLENIDEVAVSTDTRWQPELSIELDSTRQAVGRSISELTTSRDRVVLSAILFREKTKSEVLDQVNESSRNYDRVKSRGLKRLADIIRADYPELAPRGSKSNLNSSSEGLLTPSPQAAISPSLMK